MELRQLEYLLAIAEESNFTRAAEKVFVSQSALSQQIQTLEKNLGTILLDRSKRSVRLTAAGEVLCHHARRIMVELNQAEVALQELEGLQRGEMQIGVVQTVNDYLMPSVIAAFSAQYPNIRLHIEELSSDELESGLEGGDLQIAIGFLPPTLKTLASEYLFDERLVLVIRNDHPLSNNEYLSVAELDELPMIMLANTFCTRRLWEENARLASAQPQVVMEMNTVGSILSVVDKTGLPTVLPHLTLAEGYTDRLISLDLHNPTPARQVGLLWHRNNYLCSASRAFIEIAHRVAETYGSESIPIAKTSASS